MLLFLSTFSEKKHTLIKTVKWLTQFIVKFSRIEFNSATRGSFLAPKDRGDMTKDHYSFEDELETLDGMAKVETTLMTD